MSGNTQRHAIAFRNVIVGSLGVADETSPEDSLDGLNTALYPEGALAYVNSSGGTYRLNKLSTVAGDNEGVVVVPLSGPGRWHSIGGNNDPRVAQAHGTALLQASPPFSVVQSVWVALPATSDNYAVGHASGAWQLNTTTGVYTYVGPNDATYICQATATVASAVAGEAIEFALMKGAESIIGTTTFEGSAGRATVDTTVVSLGAQIATQRPLSFATGDTLLAAVRNRSGAHQLSVVQYNLLLNPC
jgi:hypothetical protein